MSQLLQAALRSGATFVASEPIYWDQGIPFLANGDISYSPSPIDHYHQGLPFTSQGRLAAELNGAVDRIGNGGAPFNAAGLLCVANVPHTYVSAGVPYTAAGQVALQT